MKRQTKFAALLSLALTLAVLASMLLVSAIPASAGEETWDDTYTSSLSGATKAEISALDADFDVYGFADPTAENGTAAKHGPAEPSVDNEPRTADTKSYVTNGKEYGSNNRGYFKFSQMNSSWYHALTYTKQSMEHFVVEYSYYPAGSIAGVVFGAAQGVFPISRDSDNTNDTGVFVYMEQAGHINIGGAIDKSTLRTAAGAAVETQSNLNNTANVRVKNCVATTVSPKSGVLADTDPCYTVVVQVQDGVLTVYEKSNQDKAVSVNLTGAYQGGYVSYVSKAVNDIALKSISFKKNAATPTTTTTTTTTTAAPTTTTTAGATTTTAAGATTTTAAGATTTTAAGATTAAATTTKAAATTAGATTTAGKAAVTTTVGDTVTTTDTVATTATVASPNTGDSGTYAAIALAIMLLAVSGLCGTSAFAVKKGQR